MASNRICVVDKKKYSYCPTCYNDSNKPKWMTTFCCEKCMTIFNTLVNETVGKITTDDAKNILSTLDLSDIDTYDVDIKNHINRVYEEGKDITTSTVASENENKETDITEDKTIVKENSRKKTNKKYKK